MAPVSYPTKAFWLLSSVCHHTKHVGLPSGAWWCFGKCVTSVVDHLQSITCLLSTKLRAGIMYKEPSKP